MPDALILDAVRTPIGRYGAATMCIGVGLGLAAVIENPAT